MEQSKNVKRRNLLQGAAAAGAVQASLAAAPPAAGTAQPAANLVIAASQKGVVETTAGKIRGSSRNGIYSFRGVPYGAPTWGAGRFVPPTKPAPWTGVRSSLTFGPICPQGAGGNPAQGDNTARSDEDNFLLYRITERQAEDCLRLNIWTPGITGSRKRPVMVWLHGGGFVGHSGSGLLAYDGHNLAERGDVVVVTGNHRLNMVGYLNLAEFAGEKYASSANLGMLDIVATLEWVRDNIANFGGDPANVTVFGQSGGGAKVSTLMAMPAAKGLFHRAIVQSGSILRVHSHEESAKFGRAVVAELGLGKSPAKSSIDKLQTLPLDVLYKAARDAAAKLAGGRPAVNGRPPGFNYQPTVDGKVIPSQIFDPAAPSVSAHVPMLIGSNLHEFIHGCDNPDVDLLTNEELLRQLTVSYGDKAQRIIDSLRREYPWAKPFDILSIAGNRVRDNVANQARRKAALGAAPAYAYLFGWLTPMLDGRPRAFHSCEISFVFNNADLCVNYSGGTPQARELSQRISDAWVQFARSGNPNHSGLPKWDPVTASGVPTMYFDNKCELRQNPEGEARKWMASAG
ncbi:MAG TPA: carboxylesterase family protein [Bryobacteraceae bacterium]|nr:carboxylesterase family protein [Bryobacteraceae bacterium]